MTELFIIMGRRKKQYLLWDSYAKPNITLEPDAPLDTLARAYADYLHEETYHNPDLLNRIRTECEHLINRFSVVWSPIWDEFLQAILYYFPSCPDLMFCEFFVDNARANGLLQPLSSSELETLREQDERDTKRGNRASIVDRFLESEA